MKDLKLTLTIKNNLLLKPIIEGWGSVKAFCTACGFWPSEVGNYINFKKSPVSKKKFGLEFDGVYFKPFAVRLADCLGCSVFDIFPKHLWEPRQSTFEKEVDSVEMVAYDDNKLIESPYVAKVDKKAIYRVLQTLTPRQEKIVRERFGLDGEVKTLRELSGDFGISPEMIRVIEAKALRKLRAPVRKKHLVK